MSSLASAAQINPTIGVFLKPITEEFGWTRSTIAGAVAIGTLVGGFAALGIGPLIDRFGPRWILSASFLVAGAALMSIGLVTHLWQFYAAVFVSRVTLQGVINLTNQTIVAKWFIRSRGRAMALANLGQRIGSGTIPFLTQQIILMANWRTAAVSVGVLVWGLTLVPVTIWLRRQPQDLGLLPDGIKIDNQEPGEPRESQQKKPIALERNYSLNEALHSRPFWIIAGAFCLTNFVNTGVNFNLIAHLTDSGLTEGEAATVLLVWALISIPATLASGLLAEKFSARPIMILLSVGLGVGIFLFMNVDNFSLGLLFAIIHGACFAGEFLMLQLLLADYYGSASLGTLRGFTTPMQMIANAIGPLSAALVYDITGSYKPILGVYIGLQVVLMLALSISLPSRHDWESREEYRVMT